MICYDMMLYNKSYVVLYNTYYAMLYNTLCYDCITYVCYITHVMLYFTCYVI